MISSYILDVLFTALRNKYDLSGYIPDKSSTIKGSDGKEYLYTLYQGIHSDEFSIMQVSNGIPHGLAQLFKNGLLILSWIMVDGKRSGRLNIYHRGVLSRYTTWDELDDSTKSGYLREFVYDVNGDLTMTITSVSNNLIIYKGGFDTTTLRMNGFGIEYDEITGFEKLTGYYRNDHLIHICQQFERSTSNIDGLMIEYSGDQNFDNVHYPLNRHPIYVGGYRFDSKSTRFIRCGQCNEINETTGICSRVVQCNQSSEEITNTESKLNNGCYGSHDGDHSLLPYMPRK